MSSGWFEVDKSGLADTVSEPARLVLELYQNAVDEDCRIIDVVLAPTDKRAYAELVVTDDSPDGFADLTESYRMYARSKKRDDPTKRGRLNIGEKRVLACCSEARITSTTGSVLFRSDGTRLSTAAKTEAGTEFRGVIRLRKAEQAEALALLRQVLVPEGISLSVNGEHIAYRAPFRTIEATLPTVLPDEDGRLSRKTRRKTTVSVVEPVDGEKPMIYEMGVPVVEHDGRWHIDVAQRVPLNDERDNVPPAYLRELRTAVLNLTHDLLTSVDAKKAWVTEALPHAEPEALRDVVEAIHGTDAVIFDPSNPEATKKAAEQGRVVVHGRQFPAAVWNKIKEADILKPAGQVIETGIPTTAGGKPPIPVEDWTAAMHALADYTRAVSLELLDFRCEVEFHNMTTFEGGGVAGHSDAWWGNGVVTFNLGRLGKLWPERVTQEEVDALIIHEFAHNRASDHMTPAYWNECCRLGAKLRNVEVRLKNEVTA